MGDALIYFPSQVKFPQCADSFHRFDCGIPTHEGLNLPNRLRMSYLYRFSHTQLISSHGEHKAIYGPGQRVVFRKAN